jgi:hypothetical protein
MELREQYDAYEAREREREEEEVEEEETAEAEGAEEGDEEAPVKSKKKKAPAKEAKPRKKAVKVVPKRVVWVVYDNSYKKVASYPYTQKKEAEEHAEKLKLEKKSTYFVQPFKEDIPS